MKTLTLQNLNDWNWANLDEAVESGRVQVAWLPVAANAPKGWHFLPYKSRAVIGGVECKKAVKFN